MHLEVNFKFRHPAEAFGTRSRLGAPQKGFGIYRTLLVEILCPIEWLVSDVLGPLLCREILGTRYPMGPSNIPKEWRPQILSSVAWIFSEIATP